MRRPVEVALPLLEKFSLASRFLAVVFARLLLGAVLPARLVELVVVLFVVARLGGVVVA